MIILLSFKYGVDVCTLCIFFLARWWYFLIAAPRVNLEDRSESGTWRVWHFGRHCHLWRPSTSTASCSMTSVMSCHTTAPCYVDCESYIRADMMVHPYRATTPCMAYRDAPLYGVVITNAETHDWKTWINESAGKLFVYREMIADSNIWSCNLSEANPSINAKRNFMYSQWWMDITPDVPPLGLPPRVRVGVRVRARVYTLWNCLICLWRKKCPG